MKLNRTFLFIELLLISIYYLMVLFSITIQPTNLILGFFIIFLLPGYNLLKILKPNFSFIEKLGYIITVSLAIENIFMFFSYIFFYNYITYPETQTAGFIFNSKILITSIISLNLIFIIILNYKNFKSKAEFNQAQTKKTILNLKKTKEILNIKTIAVSICFILSLIFLCISTLFSNVPNNDYLNNYVDYKQNFTFFNRVPLIFYAFLITSIMSLLFIIFYIKNKYFILISISFFIYCLWILPYLQIGNYFAHDTYYLSRYYEIYLNNGIWIQSSFNFVLVNLDSLRYSTSLFTTILLVNATSCSLNFALWYLYPFLYFFIPFLFFSIFKRFSKNQDNSYLILIISVVFIIFIPKISKYGHATGTGVFGLIIFFILVIELFDLIKKKEFSIVNLLFIIFLYFFLCITHTEESIYFIFLILLSNLYYLYVEFKVINIIPISNTDYAKNSSKKELYTLYQIIGQEAKRVRVKKNHIKFGILLLILILIFYFSNEIFGWLQYYFQMSFGRLTFLNFIYDIYIGSSVNIPFFLRGNIDISVIILISIFLGVFLVSFFLYVLFFRKLEYTLKIYNIGIKIIKKFFNILKKLTSTRLFQILFFPIVFLLILFLDLFILLTSETAIFLTIISLIMSYSTIIIQIFFFIKGIKYYRQDNDIQNYFLISMIVSSVITIILIIVGDIWLATYVFHTKYSSYFIFFNLIIIQNTYLKYLKEKKYNYLIIIISLTLFFGTFYTLRTLAYG